MQLQQVAGAERTAGAEASSSTADLGHRTSVEMAVRSADRRVGD